jgi:hypothetical protein
VTNFKESGASRVLLYDLYTIVVARQLWRPTTTLSLSAAIRLNLETFKNMHMLSLKRFRQIEDRK